eukprot:TRINITY_DN3405_c0_g1_i1.p1 TRINITY_DN3405_c0_g1~~TRINITY_DN3405_c0_g1_i1.p1  ORF type:complete len:188 (+),score=34.02 TRINITY_DN3405_c0_g1_i1:249-812(+)
MAAFAPLKLCIFPSATIFSPRCSISMKATLTSTKMLTTKNYKEISWAPSLPTIEPAPKAVDEDWYPGGKTVFRGPKLKPEVPDPSPEPEAGGEQGQATETPGVGAGDKYRLLLLNDERHTEELVSSVLPKVVPSVTPDHAKKCFQESREKGFSIIIFAMKEHAEFYVQMLARAGIRSAIEPDIDEVK